MVNFPKAVIRRRVPSQPKYDYWHQLLFERIQKVRDDFEEKKKTIKQKWRNL